MELKLYGCYNLYKTKEKDDLVLLFNCLLVRQQCLYFLGVLLSGFLK